MIRRKDERKKNERQQKKGKNQSKKKKKLMTEKRKIFVTEHCPVQKTKYHIVFHFQVVRS
jgi:hypothetical protein